MNKGGPTASRDHKEYTVGLHVVGVGQKTWLMHVMMIQPQDKKHVTSLRLGLRHRTHRRGAGRVQSCCSGAFYFLRL
jgi:hypothetical protein